MADAVMTYKMVVKEIAIKHGVHASFMPKPLSDAPGSAMHVHQSLFDLDGRQRVLRSEGSRRACDLSPLAKSYIAGLLKYAPEFCLVTNQTVNSYKRLVGDDKAPVQLSWARTDRMSLVRIPGYRPNRERDLPHRAAQPRSRREPLSRVRRDAGRRPRGHRGGAFPRCGRPPHARRAGRPDRCRASLGEAIELFEASDLMRRTLGDHIHRYLVDAKREEWGSYQSSVSQWERDRYLAVL